MKTQMCLLILLCTTLTLGACTPDELPNKQSEPAPAPAPPGSGGNDNEDDNSMTLSLLIQVNGVTFAATLADNATSRAFAAHLPMTVTMSEMNGNEKYSELPQPLPTDAFRPGTIHTGDLLLYGSSTLVLFYDTFSSSYSYTRLGQIDHPATLATALGRGDVRVTFEKIQNQ